MSVYHVKVENESVPIKGMYTEREFLLWQRCVDDRVTVYVALGMTGIVLTYASGFVLRVVARTLYTQWRACTT